MPIETRFLTESALNKSVSDELISAIVNGKTSLGKNPCLPSVSDTPYLERVINSEYDKIVSELKSIGRIEEVPEKDFASGLGHLILMCQKLEKPYRETLEELCQSYIVDFFGVPKDMVGLTLSLVDEVEVNDDSIIIEPVDGDDKLEFFDYAEAESMKDEIYKRRFLDMLGMGAGLNEASAIKHYLGDIYDIEPKLADMYRKILTLNRYMLFTKEDLGITDKDMKLAGTSVVTLGSSKNTVKINVQAKIFPILLSETIRAFMELFASHGLPKDTGKAKYIIGKSDFVKAEPWDMRIGPALWKTIRDSFGEAETTDIPYIFKTISKLNPKAFFIVMREVLTKTRKGRELMGKIVKASKEMRHYDGFQDKMEKMSGKVVISDEILPEEF